MKRTRKQPDLPPSGLCLDERDGLMVVADYSPDGGFEIHHAPVDERRTVNINSPQLRTVVSNADAHSRFSQANVTAANTDEEIITGILPSVKQGVIAGFTRTADGRVLLTEANQVAIS